MNRRAHGRADEPVPEKWREPTRPDDWRRPSPPKDWREVGELIRHGLRDPSRRLRTGTLWERFVRPGRTKFDLALRSAVDGDLGPLIDYLGSGGEAAEGPATDFAVVVDIFRNMVLAAALEQYLLRSKEKQNGNTPPPKRKPGPLHDVVAHAIASAARLIYGNWKQMNRDFGFSNHGISEKMKERALEIALEAGGCPGEDVDKAKLLRLMDTPKRLRARSK